MRETLIRRQSSGIGASAHFRTDRGSPFVRRTDAIAYGSCYQKAAALVDLAEDGVGLPEQILDQSTFANSASLYFCYIRFDFIWTTNLFALILLNFLEKPLWCIKGDGVDSCKNREFYFLGQLPYLTIPESFILEAACLLVLVMHTLFPIAYEGINLYWKNTVNRVKLIAILIMIADLIVYSISIPPVPSLPFRIAPYIRVMFFISDIKGLRASIVLLYGMVWTYVNVLALGFLFILFSSWLAYVIFEDTLQGKTVFTSYGSTLYQMYILFTTSNNPDVWIPAYKASRWNVIFVILYVLLGVYFVTNLILAVVYESFKTQLVKQVDRTDSQRKRILKKAFTIIDDSDVGFLNKNQCVRLFEEMNKYRTLPSISREDFELIFDALDDSHDFQINLREFTDLCHAIALRFRKEDVPSFLEDYPSVYRSRLSERVKSFVRGSEFGYLVVMILILNLVTVIVETTLDVENSSAQKSWQALEFVFGWLYVVEMCLKVYALGFENYWSGGMNRFDFTVTVIIVLGETMTFASPTALSFISDGEWIRYLILARLLRLTRILMHVRRYRAFTATFLGLIPSLLPYLGLIFCVMCVYCSLGLQVFGGIVSAGNPRIAETDLANNDYLLFNFNDYPNGMVTLFNLLVMGNWHVWMESYEELTGSPWTITYFISFYLVGVLLLLNLVVAFVLEAFVAEMELQEEDGGDAGMDAAGENRRRRVCVGSKTRSNRIDVLLHHMLSAELGRREFSPP